MLRLTSITLPVGHSDTDLKEKILQRLSIPEVFLGSYHIRRKSIDARKRGGVFFVYTIDAEVNVNEQQIAAEIDRVTIAPSMEYILPSSGKCKTRPVIIGTGPCGLFAGLILARLFPDRIGDARRLD